MKYKKITFILLIITLLFPKLSISCDFTDIDECQLPSGRGLRIAHFDIEHQRFLNVQYFHYQQTLHGEWLGPDNLGIRYSLSGNVTLPDNFDPRKHIIRTRGSFVHSNTTEHILLDGKQILRRKHWPILKPEKPEVVFQKLSSFTQLAQGTLHVFFNGVQATKVDILGRGAIYNNEIGKLGELATEMTFLSFGYFKLLSQNNNNHGLDGVYVDSLARPLYLFLTESKFRMEPKSAQTFMDEEMTEEEIWRKMEVCHPETREVIRSFVENKPEAIYKMVHRVKEGESQICIQLFNMLSYRTFRLRSPHDVLSVEDTMAIFEELIARMAQNHQAAPINMAELATLFARGKIRLNHILCQDSRELLEWTVRLLSPREIRQIREKLRVVSPDKRQIVFDLVFRDVLGYWSAPRKKDHLS